MDGVESRPNNGGQRSPMILQICLRLVAMGTSVASAAVMMTNKQTLEVQGIKFYAKYQYATAFTFVAAANIVACVLSLASLLLILVCMRKNSKPIYFFCLFIHDLLILLLLFVSSSSATTIGLIGRNGNSHMGWAAICGHFDRFCDKVTVSLVLCYISFIAYFFLTILSVHQSRNL